MKKAPKIIGLLMVLAAVVFVIFALNHPELAFRWSNEITWTIYGLYAVAAAVLLLAPIKKK